MPRGGAAPSHAAARTAADQPQVVWVPAERAVRCDGRVDGERGRRADPGHADRLRSGGTAAHRRHRQRPRGTAKAAAPPVVGALTGQPQGEAIGFEIIDECSRVNRRMTVRRMKFTAVTQAEIERACVAAPGTAPRAAQPPAGLTGLGRASPTGGRQRRAMRGPSWTCGSEPPSPASRRSGCSSCTHRCSTGTRRAAAEW